LRDGSNHRTDQYGGSVENRTRFLLEVVEAVSKAAGAERTALRLSPAGAYYISPDSDTRVLYDYTIGKLNEYGLAYLHLREPASDVSAIPNMVVDVTRHYRQIYKGTLMTNTAYDRDKGNAVIAAGQADLVAYGVPFISNPDLVERFRAGAELAKADPATFYSAGEKGYTDYPALRAAAA